MRQTGIEFSSAIYREREVFPAKLNRYYVKNLTNVLSREIIHHCISRQIFEKKGFSAKYLKEKCSRQIV